MAHTNKPNVAAIQGAATVTLQKVHLVHAAISGIEQAPDLLTDILPDLQAVKQALNNVIAEYSCENPQMAANEEVESANENCCALCTKFHDSLILWKWHAIQKETFWVDRWRVSFFGHERVKAFRAQLNLCKDILAVAMTTSRLVLTFRQQEDNLREVKEMTLKQNELFLQREIDRARINTMETELILPSMPIHDSGWLSEESKQSRWELLQEIHHQQTFNESFQRVCEQALALTTSERTRIGPQCVQESEFSQLFGDFTEREYSITTDSLGLPEIDQDFYSPNCNDLMNGILDTLSPSAQLDLLDQSIFASIIGAEDTQPQAEPDQLSQTQLTSPAQSSTPQTQGKSKPICWEHGCGGRIFSSWSNLNRHKKEKTRQEPACYCPRCGAYFSRRSGRDQHLANMSCTRIRRYSNGRIRPNNLKIQNSLRTSPETTPPSHTN